MTCRCCRIGAGAQLPVTHASLAGTKQSRDAADAAWSAAATRTDPDAPPEPSAAADVAGAVYDETVTATLAAQPALQKDAEAARVVAERRAEADLTAAKARVAEAEDRLALDPKNMHHSAVRVETCEV
jgi:hypothetical protein